MQAIVQPGPGCSGVASGGDPHCGASFAFVSLFFSPSSTEHWQLTGRMVVFA